MLNESRTKLARADSVQARLCLSEIPPFQSIVDMREMLCVIIIIAWIIVTISPAMAEVEGDSGGGEFAIGYFDSSFSFDFIINLLTNSYDGRAIARNDAEMIEYSTNNTNKSDANASRHDKPSGSENLNSFRRTLIPEAVWSLDTSTGVYFGHNFSEPGSEFDTMPEGAQKKPGFWTRASIGLEIGNNFDRFAELLATSPITIQVANCGGGSAEHRDLQYCNISGNSISNQFGNELNGTSNSTITPQSVSTTSSSTTSSISTQERPATPAFVNNIIPDSNVINLTAFADQCADTPASCATTQTAPTGSPPAPTDSPQAPNGSPPAPNNFPATPADTPPELTPPPPVISVGDPEPIPEPPITSTPPPVPSPVPETSTWIMMMVGFGIMIVACRRRASNPIKRRPSGLFIDQPPGQ